MGRLADISARFGILGEFLAYLWRRKLWWMIPLAVAVLLVGTLLIFGQATGVGPFIYTIF